MFGYGRDGAEKRIGTIILSYEFWKSNPTIVSRVIDLMHGDILDVSYDHVKMVKKYTIYSRLFDVVSEASGPPEYDLIMSENNHGGGMLLYDVEIGNIKFNNIELNRVINESDIPF